MDRERGRLCAQDGLGCVFHRVTKGKGAGSRSGLNGGLLRWEYDGVSEARAASFDASKGRKKLTARDWLMKTVNDSMVTDQTHEQRMWSCLEAGVILHQ